MKPSLTSFPGPVSNTWLFDPLSSQLLPLHYVGCPKNAIKHYTYSIHKPMKDSKILNSGKIWEVPWGNIEDFHLTRPTLSPKKGFHLSVHYQTKAVIFARNWSRCSSQGHLGQDHDFHQDGGICHHDTWFSYMTNDSHMIKMILIYDHHDNLSTLIDSSSFWTAPMKWQRPRSVPKSLAPQSNIWRIIILIVIRFSSFWPKSSSSSSSSSPAFPPNRCRAPFVHTCTGTSAETRTSPSKFSDHNMISCSKQLLLVLLGSLVSVTYYFRGTLCQICQKILAGVRPPPHS